MDKLELIKYDEDKILNRSSSFEDDAIQDVRQEGAEIIDGVVMDGMGDTTTPYIKELQKDIDEYKVDVFWRTDTTQIKPKLEIDARRLMSWLKRSGVALLLDGKSKTSSFREVSFKDGLIDNENQDTMRTFAFEYFDNQDATLWEDENKYGVYKKGESGDMWSKVEVMNKLFNYSFNPRSFNPQIKYVMRDKSYQYDTLPLLSDNQNNVYIPFANGVVHITESSIKLINYNDLDTKGYVWQSAIRPHSVEITNDKNEGVFEKFCRLATSKRSGVKLPSGTDWVDGYEINEDVFKSLKTAYGYMLSSYNNPTEPVAPIFLDGEAEIGQEEGRNGKSVVMGSIEYWKKLAYNSGKSYQSAKSSGGRFQYSNVEIDTGFVFLNDTPMWFDMEDLYDRLSDDFEVGGKYKNKFIIPKRHKPKIGITTNYPPKVKGGSARHRMHITPFGNYWLTCKERGETPSSDKHLGKMMFEDDFSKDDWNDFYNFGFECVKLYLNEGLHKCNTDGINLKGLITKWEDGKDTGIVRWLVDGIENNAIKGLSDGIGIERHSLHKQLMQSDVCKNNLSVTAEWMSNEKKFYKMTWDVCKTLGYKYNESKSHLGDTPNARRHLKKNKTTGKNMEYICITK